MPCHNQQHTTCLDFPKCHLICWEKKKWGYCKHLYYVFRLLCKVDCDGDEFIHAPTYTCDEVMRLVELDGVV